MPFKRISLIIFFLIIFVSSSGAISYFPYTNAALRTPCIDDPYPGLGSGFSSLGKSIRTSLWNPASLAKIDKSEAYLGITSTYVSTQTYKAYFVEDQTFIIENASAEGISNKILFTDDASATETATREFRAPLIYSPTNAGMEYKQAIKATDWLSFGISSRGDTDVALAMAGAFPAQYVADIDFYNQTNLFGSGLSVDSDGKVSYTQGVTISSTGPAWSGFLNQEQRVPFSVTSDMRNNVNIQSTLTFTGAAKWQGFSFGANLTPISASINVDNTAKAIVNDGTADMYIYTPNFDPTSPTDISDWTTDPNRYGTEAGYQKNYIRVPAGESIGEAKYTGFYNASTIRTDLGAMYDVGDFLTLGAVMENAGGASLNMTGIGRVAYVNTRINTSEGLTFDDTTNQIYWNPFTDTYAPMDGTENIGMLPQINVNLPQKNKIGITPRKPILMTLDYEMQSSPIFFRCQDSSGTYVDAQISNINILRAAIESQFFVLPIWLRGGISFLGKPTITNIDVNQEDLDNIFMLMGFAPLSLDLNITSDILGYKVGGAFGIDGSTILSMLQMDTLNPNFGKTMYYNLSLDRDNWHVVWQNNLDIPSTATVYSNAQKDGTLDANSDWTKYLGITKWVSTLTMGFKF